MDETIEDNYEHQEMNVFYTVTTIPGKGCNIDEYETQILLNCSCKQDTLCNNSETCACVRIHGLNYCLDGGKRKLISDKLSTDMGVVECGQCCSCGPSTCQNRLVQFGPFPHLKVRSIPQKGLGLIAAAGICKGQYVCEYAGELISKEEAVKRSRIDNVNYIFVLNEESNGAVTQTIVDATSVANIGRYINHSCSPNCKVVPVRVDSVIPKLAIFAIKDISAGEEVTYSYGHYVSQECSMELKPCFCGSQSCKKYLPYQVY